MRGQFLLATLLAVLFCLGLLVIPGLREQPHWLLVLGVLAWLAMLLAIGVVQRRRARE
jgi:hypothetical protein